jgi:glutamate decarboxylase
MPKKENSPEACKDIIKSSMALNSNETLNLATFCQTYSEREIKELMKVGETINLIDKVRNNISKAHDR